MERTVFDEERCVQALKRGDEEAFGRVIEQYTPYVGAVVSGMTGELLGREDREELVVDVFYSLWNNAAKVRPGKLKSYLAAIARNKARNALRREKQELPLEEDLLLLSPSDPERELTQAEEARCLRQALEAMPEPDRTIFIRRYWLCQKTRLIAVQMGLNESTVRTKLLRGREKLARILNEGGLP